MSIFSTVAPQIHEKPKPQPFNLIQPHDLYNRPEVEEQFLVDQLIPLAGLSLLIGNPKDGKSSLARQLAIDVAQGGPFLGMPTRQGSVIYFALEEPEAQLRKRLKLAGFKQHDPLFAHTELLPGSRSEIESSLQSTLDAYPDVNLVIVDTLFKFTRITDTNDYAKAQNSVEWLHRLAMDRGIVILGLHHSKKAASAENRSSVSVSGSNAIVGGANNVLEMYRQEQHRANSPRILRMNEYRYGTELEPTVLSFDLQSQRYSVGGLVEDATRKSAELARIETRRFIMSYVAEHPGSLQSEIIHAVPGNTVKTKAALKDLILGDEPLIRREGSGVKGDAHRYFLSDFPMEEVVTNNQIHDKEPIS